MFVFQTSGYDSEQLSQLTTVSETSGSDVVPAWTPPSTKAGGREADRAKEGALLLPPEAIGQFEGQPSGGGEEEWVAVQRKKKVSRGDKVSRSLPQHMTREFVCHIIWCCH